MRLFYIGAVNSDIGCVQNGINHLPRALHIENNHGCYTDRSHQTEVLRTGHFKVLFGMKNFKIYNGVKFTTSLP